MFIQKVKSHSRGRLRHNFKNNDRNNDNTNRKNKGQIHFLNLACQMTGLSIEGFRCS